MHSSFIFYLDIQQNQWKQIIEFIDANLHRNISLSELASIVPLSPYNFAHLFKKSTNTSPHQYLIRCRIERAKQLIVMGNLSLAAIAQTVGFASQGHFTTYHFKRLVGVTLKVFLQRSVLTLDDSKRADARSDARKLANAALSLSLRVTRSQEC